MSEKVFCAHEKSNPLPPGCSATVVKPSGHHLKLALKMQDYGKVMFKPMR